MTADAVVSVAWCHPVAGLVMRGRRKGPSGKAPRLNEDESARQRARDDGLHKVDRAQPALTST